MRLIVTGFEPFGGASLNASWEAVQRLEGVETALLPVTFSGAAARVRALARQKPDVLLCVGEAGGASRILLERVAVNLMDARIPDNDGFQPRDLPLKEGGPAAYFSGLPVRRLCEALAAADIPAALSCTAGTYVCNAVFYALMDEIAALGSDTAGGFIHVPAVNLPVEQSALALQLAVDLLRGEKAAR